ncbi:hypothetical protein AMAG_06096 [Allomyces macrogynus ATCC 38327]|uniref:Uncharacterized protein n=1 Tax=Allomyces macrogynus (strain ATCC 38327) TaxID=578462 RepID=A0A0L0SE76_ALLM3|nr:hypothetical protein AMAG_06096 [Allomyces macrogynus ATCC 38327]|eukprot:KNE60734.1 hypothetical protein AMAG_06096 [Allomyces macrogynus ATCC 38327]
MTANPPIATIYSRPGRDYPGRVPPGHTKPTAESAAGFKLTKPRCLAPQPTQASLFSDLGGLSVATPADPTSSNPNAAVAIPVVAAAVLSTALGQKPTLPAPPAPPAPPLRTPPLGPAVARRDHILHRIRTPTILQKSALITDDVLTAAATACLILVGDAHKAQTNLEHYRRSGDTQRVAHYERVLAEVRTQVAVAEVARHQLLDDVAASLNPRSGSAGEGPDRASLFTGRISDEMTRLQERLAVAEAQNAKLQATVKAAHVAAASLADQVVAANKETARLLDRVEAANAAMVVLEARVRKVESGKLGPNDSAAYVHGGEQGYRREDMNDDIYYKFSDDEVFAENADDAYAEGGFGTDDAYAIE